MSELRWDEYVWKGDGIDPFVYTWEQLEDGQLTLWQSVVVFPPRQDGADREFGT